MTNNVKKILFINSDSFYNNPQNFFNPHLSSDNLVFGHYLLKQSLDKQNIKYSFFSKGKIDLSDYNLIIFNELPIKGSREMKALNDSLNLNIKKILIAMESEVVRREYETLDKCFPHFDLVYTWNENFKKFKNFRKYNFSIFFDPSFSIEKKRKLINCIAANKLINHRKALYKTRYNLIKKFQSSKLDFDLFGYRWGKFVIASGIIGSPINKLLRFLPDLKKLSSWQGVVKNKSKVMELYDFSLVVENANLLQGYVTEKILHALNAGTIPIYLGEENIFKFIPKDFVICIKDYNSFQDLEEKIFAIKYEEKVKIRKEIKNFIIKNGLLEFSAKSQANKLFKGIKELIY